VGGEMTCEQDKAVTRLTCTQCASPICPQCLVRTPVGLKCTSCGAGPSRDQGASYRRRAWSAAAVAGLVLLAVVALPRLLPGSSDTAPSKGAEEPGSFVPNPEGRARFSAIGGEALDGNAAFQVSSFECGATEVGTEPSLRRSQGRYCFLAVTIRNVGRGPVQLFPPGQVLIDSENRRYGVDERATAAHPANAGRDPVAAVINPSNELNTVFVFDVPPFVEPQMANLRATPEGQGAIIRLTPPP
jgi:hypothetical protein